MTELEQRADTVNDCCTVERSAVGKENHLVRLGSRVVLIHDWVEKAGSPGTYSGFSMTVSDGASMSYLVKAGTQTYNGSQESWSRDDSQAIAYVDFCHECDNPDGCDGGGGGGGDGDGDGDGGGNTPPPDPDCTSPDGCDEPGDGWDGPL